MLISGNKLVENLQIYQLAHSQMIPRPSAGAPASSFEWVRRNSQKSTVAHDYKSQEHIPFPVHLHGINEATGKK